MGNQWRWVRRANGDGRAPGEDTENWWQVLRVSACRTAVTMVTTLMCMPLATLTLGWSPSVVVSGSMEPALSRGDVVAVRQVRATEVGAGAVISFADTAHGGRSTTHRAVKRQNFDTFVTKGDANRDPDPQPVTPDRLRGVVTAVVPVVGTGLLWLDNGDWVFLVAAVLLYTVLLAGCRETLGRRVRI
ncbi:signal peptidase I [Streptomyces sp. NPDC090025]|uniref:signal peptidase I n=1 Tax=Streptomyces sp. NPDC090025 TaxID=3365922 RepID=UPI0038382F50